MKKLNTLLFNQGGKCFYCDAVLDIDEATIDHVIPQSKGGTNNLDNLVICCKYANHAFRDYSPKQKMAVIKQLCGSPSLCQQIFPRKPEIIDEIENDSSIDNELVLIEKNTSKTGKTGEKKQNQKDSSDDLKGAYQLLCQAIEALESQGKKVNSSSIKSKIRNLNPSFNELDYGFTQFKKFLLRAQEDNVIALKNQSGGNFIIKKV
jgi:hypothetical protein